jgi:hypothetical protein
MDMLVLTSQVEELENLPTITRFRSDRPEITEFQDGGGIGARQ